VQSAYGFALILGIGFAAVAGVIGLAPIIGAFLAGMVLAEIRDEHALEAPIRAVEAFLAPVFFAVVGLQLELSALTSSTVLIAGSVVSLIAIAGKLIGGFVGAIREGTANALIVGTGMVPRGEVGLIVAAIGMSAGAVSEEEYAIVIFMVVATTVLAPLALRPLIAWAERVQNPSKGVK
jgi:Kef-type K+ transport system membrane component KefB